MRAEKSPTRRSSRVPTFSVSNRMEKLFFAFDDNVQLPKNFEILNRDPPIYRIHNFLSEGEFSFYNKICTQYANRFSQSFTEDDSNGKVMHLSNIQGLI